MEYRAGSDMEDDGSRTGAAEHGSVPALDILILDDEPRVRTTLSMCLQDDGHRVETAEDAAQAFRAADFTPFDLAFVDLKLPGSSGLDAIPGLLERLPWLKIIVITAHASVESAVEAMKRGAVDYLPKPFSTSEIRLATRNVAELRALELRVDALEEELEGERPRPLLDSDDPEMRRVLEMAREVSDTDAILLLQGESGTGKGILARAVHGWSPRSDHPFAIVHCPSIPSELLESELFGHVKGAFTGAVRSNPGRISRCQGGTLFLDEIGDLPLSVQPKLLRFVEDREYERVGDPTPRRADVRIIAATNQDLEEAVAERQFREDLYYRLNVVELRIPPLRNRGNDLLTLADRFLAFYARKHRRPALSFSPDAEEALRGHPWPGNVRELENVIERAVILCREREIQGRHLPFSETEPGAPRVGGRATLADLEEEHIRRVLTTTDTLTEASRILGISTSTLWRRRKRYGI